MTGCGGDPILTTLGWYCGNANNTTHAVAGLAANAYGLYDMLGNAAEWTDDLYALYQIPPIQSDKTPEHLQWRVVRGGDFSSSAFTSTPRYRHPLHAGTVAVFRKGSGFRCAKDGGVP